MKMNAERIKELVNSQIGDRWDTKNDHGVVLRETLVPPEQITVIERLVRNSKPHDRLVDVWVVLIEEPKSGSGYRIVAALDGGKFGLASGGFPSDGHLVLCGWYGDFLTTFRAM
jgi:hypothetical protein